jgi:hypothetical protein
MWLLQFFAKMRFRPKGGIAFLPPDFSSSNKNYNLIGCAVKFLRLRKKPLFSVNPLRNKFQSKELPICAKVEQRT